MNRIFVMLIMLCLFLISKAQTLEKDTVKDEESMAEMLKSIELRLEGIEKASIEKNKTLGKNLQVGLSFGFNAFVNGPRSFYIKEDSSIGTYGKTKGVSGMLSALLGYKVNNRHTIYLNIPLRDFTSTPDQAIGVFNKKIAGGLGYGYSMGKLSIITVVNLFPYESIALEVLAKKKFSQEAFSVLSHEGLPTTSHVSPSLTLGICYNLLKPRDASLLASN